MQYDPPNEPKVLSILSSQVVLSVCFFCFVFCLCEIFYVLILSGCFGCVKLGNYFQDYIFIELVELPVGKVQKGMLCFS